MPSNRGSVIEGVISVVADAGSALRPRSSTSNRGSDTAGAERSASCRVDHVGTPERMSRCAPLPFLCRNLSSKVAAISIRWVPKRDLRQPGSFVAAGRSHPISGVLHLDLTDEEAAALIKELADITGTDRYSFSPRIQILRAILASNGRQKAMRRPTGRTRSE
jgi:hypothetical protein